MHCKKYKKIPSPPAPGGILNIFLHGLMGVRIRPQFWDVLIPNMGTLHTYRYGEFMGEVTLQPSRSSYQISNIVGGNAVLNRTEHLVARDANNNPIPVCNTPDLYATICLPQPAAVYSVLQVDLTDRIEDPLHHLGPTGSPKIASLIPVWAYTFADPGAVLFGGEPLNVAPVQGADGIWYMNLHIFAEEDLERDEEHSIDGFSVIAGVFDFPTAPRLVTFANLPALPVPNDVPPGTTPLEFTSLALRNREAGYLGRTLRQELLHGRRAMVLRLSPLGSDPVACIQLNS